MARMTKLKKKLTSPIATVVLFAIASVLLLGSTIGGTRAALTYYSDNYTASVEMYNIGVTLLENGKQVSWRNYGDESDGRWTEKHNAELLSDLKALSGKDAFKVGRVYPEELAVYNSGTIDQYVRVTLYKYWLDENGEKMQELSPDLIELELNLEAGGNGSRWMVDGEASTDERTVLYYSNILQAGGTSIPLSTTLKVDDWVASRVTRTETTDGNGRTTITTSYDYDGVSFQLEARVDAVQTHSAADAIWSAWGRRVNIGANGVLSLISEGSNAERALPGTGGTAQQSAGDGNNGEPASGSADGGN